MFNNNYKNLSDSLNTYFELKSIVVDIVKRRRRVQTAAPCSSLPRSLTPSPPTSPAPPQRAQNLTTPRSH